MRFRNFCGVAALAVALAVPASAQEDFSAEFGGFLSEGQTTAAAEAAAARLAAAPDDVQAGFALGVAQFLGAVETLVQGLHRYGLASDYDPGLGLLDLPFLRLPVPPNANPDMVTYDGLRQLLERFVADLAQSEATLAALPDAEVDLQLDLNRIRLDLDGNGAGADDQRLLDIFAAVSGGGRVGVDFSLPVDLDQSDVPWLRGYCNLLMAMSEFLLAHDWERAFDATFHNIFPGSQMPSSALAEASRQYREIVERGAEPMPWTGPRYGSDYWQAYQAWLATPEGEGYMAYRAAEEALEWGSIADLIAFVHLFDWPVVEPARMASTRQRLLAMVALSRESWARIFAETDNRNEWVPKPGQNSVVQRLRVTEDTVAGWQAFLDAFEAVLTGEKLVPHWRFEGRGVNVRRMFDEPRAFAPLLIAQGSAVIPYLEEGDTVSGETVFTVVSLMGSGFFRYFVWFN